MSSELTAIARQAYALFSQFAYLYPMVMAYVWMLGAVMYWFRFERGRANYDASPKLPSYPLVSILVPCYNESANVRDTFDALENLHYPNYEVIAVNDGSKDDTGACLEAVAQIMPRMRVVHLATNQ